MHFEMQPYLNNWKPDNYVKLKPADSYLGISAENHVGRELDDLTAFWTHSLGLGIIIY